MKTQNNRAFALKGLSMLVLAVTILSMQGCSKKDATPSVKEITTKQVSSGVWKTKSVTVDGTDKTDVYKNFTLQYTATAYTTTSGAPVWPASGNWTFKDDTAKIIVRDDGLEITIESLTDTEFIYSLTWSKTTYGAGRFNSVSGVHKFDMVH